MRREDQGRRAGYPEYDGRSVPSKHDTSASEANK